MAKKTSVPKKVAGLKLPKTLRRYGLVKAMLASPAGRDILAKVLVAAAGAIAAVLVRDRKAVAETGEQVAKAGKKGVKKGAEAAGIFTEALQSAASAVAEAIGDAAGKKKDASEKETARH